VGGDRAAAARARVVDPGVSRRTGLRRETTRRAIVNDEPPRYSREGRGSKAEIARLLREDCDLPGVRIGEPLEPLGWDGGKTILDDYLREVRPLFRAARTTQRTIYRPGEICQFDVWQPRLQVLRRHPEMPQNATPARGCAPYAPSR